MAFLALTPKETQLYLGGGSGLSEVPADQLSFIKNSPLTPPGTLLGSSRGVVLVPGSQVRAVDARGGQVLAQVPAGHGLVGLQVDAALDL